MHDVGWGVLGHVLYLLVLGGLGVVGAARRLERLLLLIALLGGASMASLGLLVAARIQNEELASGLTEASSAAEELRRSMEQIASGAEEAASAAQETLAVAANTAATLLQARDHALHRGLELGLAAVGLVREGGGGDAFLTEYAG